MSYDEETVVRERLHRVLPLAMDDGDDFALSRQPVLDALPGAGFGLQPADAVPNRFGVGDPSVATSTHQGGGAFPTDTAHDGIGVEDLAAGSRFGVRPGRPRIQRGPLAVVRPRLGGVTPAISTDADDAPAPTNPDDMPPAIAHEEGWTADGGGRSRGGAGRALAGPGAFDPGRRGVRVLAVVAVLVVLGAAFWAWRSRPQAEPVTPVVETSAVAPAPAGSEPSPTAGAELVVAVAGKVRRPGLVRVPAGARVADVVQAAGGALPGVDVALLNPARKVADGELILVGVAAPPGAAPSGPDVGAVPGAGGKVNLNTATLAQLDALPGVGPVLAQRILTHRDQQGGFRSVSDLRQVDGIGDARYEQLKDLVTV